MQPSAPRGDLGVAETACAVLLPATLAPPPVELSSSSDPVLVPAAAVAMASASVRKCWAASELPSPPEALPPFVASTSKLLIAQASVAPMVWSEPKHCTRPNEGITAYTPNPLHA